MKPVLLLIGIIFMNQSIFSQCDSVVFSSDKVGLVILTQNPDSVKYYSGKGNYPNPFSPSTIDVCVFINSLEENKLTISVKNYFEECLMKFIWDKISPGSYRFDWWLYMHNPPSGVYFTEKIIGNDSVSHKVVLVK